MAKIPEYQQQKLASSVVGVAEGSSGSAQLFNNVAQQASNISGTLLVEAMRNKRQLDAEERALATAKAKMVADTEVAKHKFYLGQQLEAEEQKTKTDFINTPTDAPTAFNGSGEKLLQSYVENITDPTIKAEVLKVGYGELGARANSVATWSHTAETQRVTNEADKLLDDFAISIGNSVSPEDAKARMDKFEQEQGRTYTGVLGTGFAEKLRDAKEKGAINYLSRLVEGDATDVALAEQIVSGGEPDANNPYRGAFKDLISQTRVQEVFSDIRRQARAAKAIIDQQERDEVKTQTLGLGLGIIGAMQPNGGGITPAKAQELKDQFPKANAAAQINLAKQAQRAVEKDLSGKTDAQVARHVGVGVANLNKLAQQINELDQMTRKPGGKDRVANLARLNNLYQAYNQRSYDVAAAVKMVEDPNVKAQLNAEIDKVQGIRSKLPAILNKNPDVMKAETVRRNFVGKVPRTSAPYGADTKKNAIYKYYFDAAVDTHYAEIMNRGKDPSAVAQNSKALYSIAKQAAQYAAVQTQRTFGGK